MTTFAAERQATLRTRAAQRTLAAAALLVWIVHGHGAQPVSVHAERQGSAVAVYAAATLRVPRAVIWATLTDYGQLHEFIPGIVRSRIVESRGPTTVVEQVGEARFLVFRYPIAVVVESTEHPPARIDVKLRAGNLKQLDGGYELELVDAANDVHVLRWRGVIEPDTVLPLFLTVPLMRSNIEDQFLGMVNEIERRHARAGTPAADR